MANTNLDQVIDVIGQDVRDILRRLDDLGISINNITVSTNDRVNKSGDTMTGILEIDKGDSYVRGKVGRTNKWYVGKGSSSSDDITLWSDVYNSGVTLKRDRTEVTKPLYIGRHKVFHEGDYPEASDTRFGLVKLSHRTGGTDRTKAASEYALSQLASSLNQNQGFTQNLEARGWVRLPNGLILQWSNYNYIASSASKINFPIIFPNRCCFIALTPYGPGNIHAVTLNGYENMSVSGFYCNTNVAGIMYLAIGY